MWARLTISAALAASNTESGASNSISFSANFTLNISNTPLSKLKKQHTPNGLWPIGVWKIPHGSTRAFHFKSYKG
jgi:hypothetical protein